MLINALYVLLVISAITIVGVVIAGFVRVRKHMAKPPDQTTIMRKRDQG